MKAVRYFVKCYWCTVVFVTVVALMLLTLAVL